MNFPWMLFVDLGLISAGLLLATLIRAKVAFFQNYLIPNALTAGFILLPFYNFVAPLLGLTTGGLGAMVYHLLAISFISMTLRKSPITGKKGDLRILSTSVSVLSQYAIQTLLGLGFTLLFIATFSPNLFRAFGLLLPLGFVLGPGQAYAIGQGWEGMGFMGAGTIGLTFAALGFLWACFGGIFLINYGLRKGWMTPEQMAVLRKTDVKTGVLHKGAKLQAGSHITTETEAIDTMTFNLAMVMVVYLLTWLLLHLLTWLLSFAGRIGQDLAINLWGIHFIFAAIMAIGAKVLLRKTGVDYILDNGSLTRLSGLSVDLMVASSIAAISLTVVVQYWLPIIALSTLGGVIVLLTVPWFCSRLFTDHRFHRTLMIYGVSTGTMPTGLALLRVIDPDFETPVATDYMYAAGLTFVLVIPFIMVISFPMKSYTDGNPVFFWITVAVAAAYLVFVLIAFFVISKRRAYKDPSALWLKEEAQKSA